MNKHYVIGIDMGGTNTTFGIVDKRGVILYRDQIKTGGFESGEAYADALCASINALISKAEASGDLIKVLKEEIKGIGIGAPNGNYRTGTLDKAANISWAKNKVVYLADMIKERTGLHCTLTNDANAAAIGEREYGVAKGLKDFIVITLGTGVGSGIVSGGRLITGHDGLAGELGHNIVRRYNGRPCGCGRSGCLETYTSANGVARTAREFLEIKSDKPSLLREITDRPITSKDVHDAAKKGDEIAIEVFNYTGQLLGESFADFLNFSSPEAIILFGGLTKAGDFILKPLVKAFKENTLCVYEGKTRILFSGVQKENSTELSDEEAAILGASALAWES